MFQLDIHSAPLFRNKENNMLNKRIGLLALGVLSATQAMAKETLKKTSISGEIHASHELNG